MSDIPALNQLKKITVGKALQTVGQATSSTLVQLTNKAPTSVKREIKTLYTKNKIYIYKYLISDTGKITRVWAWGDKDDAKEPRTTKPQEKFIPRSDDAGQWLRNPI